MRALSNVWSRLHEWLTRVPESSYEDLVQPEHDDELADAMRNAAKSYAARTGSDFSLESIPDASRSVRTTDEQTLPELAAYVGEVLVRRGCAYWGRGGRHGEQPGLIIGKWVTDPREWIENIRADPRLEDGYLVESVNELLAVASDPSGLLPKAVYRAEAVTAWEDTRHRLARRQRQWRRRS
jgi:hypothetical protein